MIILIQTAGNIQALTAAYAEAVRRFGRNQVCSPSALTEEAGGDRGFALIIENIGEAEAEDFRRWFYISARPHEEKFYFNASRIIAQAGAENY